MFREKKKERYNLIMHIETVLRCVTMAMNFPWLQYPQLGMIIIALDFIQPRSLLFYSLEFDEDVKAVVRVAEPTASNELVTYKTVAAFLYSMIRKSQDEFQRSYSREGRLM